MTEKDKKEQKNTRHRFYSMPGFFVLIIQILFNLADKTSLKNDQK
jgi:hypothetical protein